jgi:hypothetical protein
MQIAPASSDNRRLVPFAASQYLPRIGSISVFEFAPQEASRVTRNKHNVINIPFFIEAFLPELSIRCPIHYTISKPQKQRHFLSMD